MSGKGAHAPTGGPSRSSGGGGAWPGAPASPVSPSPSSGRHPARRRARHFRRGAGGHPRACGAGVVADGHAAEELGPAITPRRAEELGRYGPAVAQVLAELGALSPAGAARAGRGGVRARRVDPRPRPPSSSPAVRPGPVSITAGPMGGHPRACGGWAEELAAALAELGDTLHALALAADHAQAGRGARADRPTRPGHLRGARGARRRPLGDGHGTCSPRCARRAQTVPFRAVTETFRAR